MEAVAPVAVVDDDASVRRALSRLLRSAGFEVSTFGSAREYLDARHLHEANCLVLDVHLGGMSGFELEERLRETGSMVPVIFITAHDDETTRERARRAGASAYLPKPFDATALLDAVRSALGAASR